MFKIHKDEVWGAAQRAAELKYGPLLMTCAAGKQCRTDRKNLLIGELQDQWHSVLSSFKATVEAQIVTSKAEVSNTYVELIACAVDNQCCEWNPTVVRNTFIEITGFKSKIHSNELKIAERQIKLEEIENECPAEWAAF